MVMMEAGRPSQEKTQQQVHSVRITLSSKNVKNLEKVCAELVSGAKNKRLKVDDDEGKTEKILPITTRVPHFGGSNTLHSRYQRPSKRGCTNFRWSPYMSRFLLPFLVNQVKLGQRVNKAFRRQAFIDAAQAVNDKFKLNCTDTNVMNHLRTIKARYAQIKKLQSLSNITWDDKEKKIIMDEATYNEYVKVNPKDEPYLNKRIELYDEMAILCEYDHSIEEFDDDSMEGNPATAVDDVKVMMDENIDDEEVGEAPQSPSNRVSASSDSTERTEAHCCNMSHDVGAKIEYLAFQIGQLADAIRNGYKSFSSELFAEVMKSEGYDEVSLGKAFDYLHEHENLGRAFIAKNHNLRQAWLSDFFSQRHTS